MAQKKGKDLGWPILTSSPLLLLLALTAAFGIWFLNREQNVRELSYGHLMHICKADDPTTHFNNVLIRRGSEIRGELIITDTISDGKLEAQPSEEKKLFRTRIGLASDALLMARLDERAGPNYQGEEERTLQDGLQAILLGFVMIFPFLIFGFFLLRWMSGGGGALTFGRSKHKLYAQKDLKITFQDVAGIDEAVAELREIVDFLKTPEKYQALGGRIPKGVLLVGPPGTGKTLLGKAVAGEADVPFFSMSGSDFVELFVGVGASRVRDLFNQADTQAPCIVFIDELDALGKTRGGLSVGGHDEREQTLNQLLVEMDGFDSNRGVIIMAATNRPETLDPALMRPGRFDRTVVVDRPDLVGREAILKVHTRAVKLADDVDLRHVASLTPGSAGADLANIVNEAALLAARKSRIAVAMADFNEAVERGAIGLERKSRIMTPEDKLRVAYHEGGHALVACALPNTSPVHKITIIPRGVGALGYVLRRSEDERYMKTKGELESDIKVSLGGTIAEEIIYGEIANGATSDLNYANMIGRKMVKMYGMSRLGRIYYPDETGNPFLGGLMPLEGPREYSEETAREIDMEVRKIIEDSLGEVRKILADRRGALEAVAKLLMEKETIDGNELRELLEAHHSGPKLVPASEAIVAVERPSDDEPKEVRDSVKQ
ncbi:MAG: ATP-dependent zinc metalloprotease FtsH [Gemmataceae bacterium]|nr:ATP-dependent zinc metalloprotease FtsH [Gemmataceae bacterium]